MENLKTLLNKEIRKIKNSDMDIRTKKYFIKRVQNEYDVMVFNEMYKNNELMMGA
jgi:hypothetical protein